MHDPLLTAAKPASLRRRLIWGAALLVVAGAIAWVVFHPRPDAAAQQGGGRGGRGARMGQLGPTPVVAATVKKADLDITINALGTVVPLATVTVKTQIPGQLQEIAFKEGQTVKKGDFLAQIDPRPYQAVLDQYSGQLLKDKALLQQAELDLKRYKGLLAEDSIASQTVDTQSSLVQQYRGIVETDQAQVNNAKLNLTYCHIVAPVSGRVGLRQVDLGNYVQTSDAGGLVVITQMQPMSVVFTLAEDNLPDVLKQVNKGASLKVNAYAKQPSNVLLASGTLESIDSQIDTTTGTIKLRSIFANEPQILFPQQFVNVVLLVDTLKDAKTVPSAAVQTGSPGTYVYLVKDDGTVTVRPIKTGPQSGDRVAVLSGLDFGDKVVVDGADKLREGAKVTLPTAAAEGGAPADPAAAGGERRRRRDGNGEAGGGKPDAPTEAKPNSETRPAPAAPQ